MKQWAKEFVKSHNVGDFAPARELIPTMAAIDSVLLQDRQRGAINSVALERLARRGFGVVRGCRNVWEIKDWKEPSDVKAKGSWRSKVDSELWTRIEPSRLPGDEHLFINRAHEDEVRAEMDREAGLLKARNKLAQHSA